MAWRSPTIDRCAYAPQTEQQVVYVCENIESTQAAVGLSAKETISEHERYPVSENLVSLIAIMMLMLKCL